MMIVSLFESIVFFIKYLITIVRLDKIKIQEQKRRWKKQQQQQQDDATDKKSRNSKGSMMNWPDPPLDKFGDSTKILWGYWHSGRDTLPAMCQLALKSWKVHHPNWDIILLCDDNLHLYIPTEDLPNNYHSGISIPQHRSDTVRLSVLIRYGGVYMDISTVVLKSFDEIWERYISSSGDGKEGNQQQQQHVLLLTAPMHVKQTKISIFNNALLMVPHRFNPILKRYQKKLLEYAEQPCQTVEELTKHKLFQRVLPIMRDPGLGILNTDDMRLYMSYIFLLLDSVLYNNDNQDNQKDNDEVVIVLPALRWSFEFLVFGHANPWHFLSLNNKDEEEKIPWGMGIMLLRFYRVCRNFRFGKPSQELANLYIQNVMTIKVSTASPDFHTHGMEQHNSTLGRILHEAVNPECRRMAQLTGARKVQLYHSQQQLSQTKKKEQ